MHKSNLAQSELNRFFSAYKRHALLGLLLILLTVSAAAFVSSKRKIKATVKNASPTRPTNTQQRHLPRDMEHVQRVRLHPMLQSALDAMGDRLEKPGKEAVIITGRLTRDTADGQLTRPVRITWQQPHRIRIEERGGGNQDRLTTFDGQTTRKNGGAIDRHDRELIESLVFDSTDHFFFSQMQGAATRHLGSHFRLDDGNDPNYAGPYYDVYRVEDHADGDDQNARFRQFFFNSDTLLLDMVRYDIERDGQTIRVEVKLDNWQESGGQRFARSITRLENGQSVLSLTINSINVGGKLDTGLFALAQ